MIEWKVEVWDSDGQGMRLSQDVEGSGDFVEFGLVCCRSEAESRGMLDHYSHGDSSARVDLKKLDPECSVYLFGGLAHRGDMVKFLRAALALLEPQKEGV